MTKKKWLFIIHLMTLFNEKKNQKDIAILEEKKTKENFERVQRDYENFINK